ncbi:iron chaperone [Spirosoma jeollabukense]
MTLAIDEKIRFPTVDDYIADQPAPLRATLTQLRKVIAEAAPDAEELISYQMPAFRFHGRFVWYAATKNHIGLYVLPIVLKVFKERLAGYELTKSTIRFPLNEPIPEALVTEIIEYGVKINLERVLMKNAGKSQK